MTTKQPVPKPVKTNLSYLFRNMTLSKAAKTEALGIAKMIHDKDGALSAADVSQIRELAQLLTRMEQANMLAARAMAEDNADEWMKLARQIDNMTTAKRGLLKDLKATRYNQPQHSESMAEKKAKQQSGNGWSGIV